MEVYGKQATTVTFPMPTGFSEVQVELLDSDGTRIWYGNPSAQTGSSIDFVVPYRATKVDKTISAVVTFTVDGEREDFSTDIDVITPILPLADVKTILGASTTDDRGKDIERRVRTAIQVYTGQVFSEYEGVVSVYGSGDRGLKLPRKLISLTSVQYDGLIATVLTNINYLIKADGWYLETPSPLFWDIKDAPPEDVLDQFTFNSSGIIAPPASVSSDRYNNFQNNIVYEVTGTFGYKSVPYDVVQAAKYLVNDYGCNESLYRDRYLDSISAADWRFSFNPQAFSGTGNVQADQILDQYKPNLMSVI